MIDEIYSRFLAFRDEAVALFATDESSIHRVVAINKTYESISGISTKQEDLLRQSLRCVEVGAYRAAHVMAWAAIIDRVQEKMASDGFVLLNATLPKWQIKDLPDLRERFTEYAIIDAAKAMNIVGKVQCKALHGLLSRRNECAHPSDYYPDLNQALGFASEVIARMKELS